MSDGAAPLSLRANASWSLLGNAVYLVSQWAMLSVIARMGTPQMVGQFALALAVTAPVIMFCNLNLAVLQATDATRRYSFEDYLGLRIATSTIALIVILGLAFGVGYPRETSVVILAVGAAKAVESLSDIAFGLFQQRQRMDVIGKALMIKGPLSVVAFGAALYWTRSVLWGAISLTVVWAALLLTYESRRCARLLGSGWRPERSMAPARWRALALLAWPMGIVALVNALVPNIPRYFIEHELGEAALGFYAAMAYLITAGQAAMNALASSANPQLADRYARGMRDAFCQLTVKTLAIGALGGAGAVLLSVLAGERLLAVLYTPEYASHAPVLVYLTLAGALGYMSTFIWNGVTAARHFKAQLPVYAGAVGTALCLNAVLVPRFGLRGAAMASIATAFVQMVGMTRLFQHALQSCGRSRGAVAPSSQPVNP